MEWKQTRPRFELVSSRPVPTTIYIYIYIYISQQAKTDIEDIFQGFLLNKSLKYSESENFYMGNYLKIKKWSKQ